MAPVVTNIAAKDGNGAAIPGGVDFLDLSGTGAGPWVILKSLIDGGGSNSVQIVTAAGAAKVDGSGVTQPVSQIGAPWSENVSQLGGTAVATETDTGSAVLQASIVNMTAHLRAILNALVRNPSLDPTGRVRVYLEQTTNLGYTALGVQLGGVSSLSMARDTMMACWSQQVRTHFT